MKLHAGNFYDGVGTLGVNTFFVLSGFLIPRGIMRNIEAGEPIAAFYVKRFCRILPPYYLTLLVLKIWGTSIYRGVAGGEVIQVPSYAWYFGYNWHLMIDDPAGGRDCLIHLWTLSVEEQFYTAIPWIFYGLAWGGQKGFAKHVPLVLILIAVGATWRSPNEARCYLDTLPNLLSLGLGAFLAFHEKWFTPSRGCVVSLVALLIGALCADVTWNHVSVLNQITDTLRAMAG
jgi:peptidoglycan/LPS O-acetylase OafA/YrhL